MELSIKVIYPAGCIETILLQRTPVEPPEDYIATLVSMGFDRNSARQVLMRAGNDINIATNVLLEAQSQ